MRLFPQTLLDALVEAPERTAFEHERRHVSYDETLAMVRRVRTGLHGAGLGPGRVVAMDTSLTPEAFAAHVAAFALGCVVVGVRPEWTESQHSGVLGKRVDAVVVDAATATPGLLAIAGAAAALSLGDCPGADDLLTAPDDGRSVIAEARAHDVARVNFTSGSSGRPKGCAWSYEALNPAFDPARWPPDLARLISCFERCLVFGTWSMPVMMTFAARCLLVGGTVVVAADARKDLPHAIERHRITGALTPVPALHRMLDVLGAQPVDVSCLRALVVTGSPATPRLLADAVARLGPVVWQGYGQSESGMISLLTPDHIARSPTAALVSVGKVLPHVEVSVRDPDGRPVPVGGIGQIFVRSPQLMARYWGDDEVRTGEVLRDGWLDTRDLGHLTPDGFLHLTGRVRDVIMVDAHVHYAAPIERVLAGHPDIDQAYVIGAPDKRTGEAIHAFVVPRDGRAPDPDILSSLVRVELGAESVPTTMTVIPHVPLTPGGKPDKNALLRDLPVPTPPDPI
ncbi:MAG: class I adenylate-forming enzyme family protein [Jiangellaceae bacterium]